MKIELVTDNKPADRLMEEMLKSGELVTMKVTASFMWKPGNTTGRYEVEIERKEE